MAPLPHSHPSLEHLDSLVRRNASFNGHWRDGATPEGYILESWSEGFMVGALMIMACITVANMRKGVILHKLILLEVRGHHPLCLVPPPRADQLSFSLQCHMERSVSWISMGMDGIYHPPQHCSTAHGSFTISSPGSKSDLSSSDGAPFSHQKQDPKCR